VAEAKVVTSMQIVWVPAERRNWAMRAALRVRIGNWRGPPAFAPVIWLACRLPA